MNIALLTQDDPFYMPEVIKDFINNIGNTGRHCICVGIVSDPSPFGKKEGFKEKIKKTLRIFGASFFLRYSYEWIIRKYVLAKSVEREISEAGINTILLKDSINQKKNIEKIKYYKPDIIVIIAGNQIIKKDLLVSTKYGVINAHTSLLPDYKGLMPTFWVLKNNEKETGVTVFRLTEGIDDGPIIKQEKLQIEKNMTQRELIIKTKKIANRILIESLNEIEDGVAEMKENCGGIYYKFPTREDVKEFYRNGKRFY
ncbi:formyltransferase family protein [Prosthecochloris sp. SCSIO W1101]|uniref:formyltransferase family protein n=1 Tax=Prosthecochloris sp. SCSIO W1101 TaxID=2992242 RepID=UPI00223C9806|nr:formyltransferase family protein [Prosthecochloris sp. SCSIO W1101]UZJ41969.1 formyltransferase family protein [Prosthecochloris sp. SCSIO W1101]